MSEQTNEADNVEEVEEAEGAVEAPPAETDISETRQKATAMGWKEKDDHEGNPENWLSPGAFLRFESLKNRVNELNSVQQKSSKDFERRLEENNKLHQFNLDQTKKQLESKRLAAVEEGDAESFKAHQAQIDEINQQATQMQSAPATPTPEPEIQTWVSRNPWVSNGHASYDVSKARVADVLLNDIEHSNPHMNRNKQLELLDNKLGTLYGNPKPENPKRTMPNMTESRAPVAKSRDKKAKSFADLYDDEKAYWNEVAKDQPRYAGNEKAFFKVVNDARNRK